MKNFGEKGAWAYPGTAQFFWYPLLSEEREKLQISNLAGTFRGSVRTKAIKILEKRERGCIQGLPNFFRVPPYLGNGESYGFQIWPVHLEGPSEQKPIKNFGEKGG